MSEAVREKAIERLAGVLMETRQGGQNIGPSGDEPYEVDFIANDDPAHAGCSCGGGADHLAQAHGRHTARWQEALSAARATIDTLGLVAIDPALLSELERYPEDDETGHSADNDDCGFDGKCGRCRTKDAIADAVLAQLRGGQ